MKTSIRRRGEALLAATGLLALAATLGALVYDQVQQQVFVLNGTALPLELTIDGARLALRPGVRESIRVRPGVRHVLVQSGGTTLDEDWIDVPTGMDAVVYNPLGAALLCLREVRYADSWNKNSEAPPPPRCYPGTTFWMHPKVDYVFETPPKTIEMDKRAGYVKKSAVAQLGDWRQALGYAATEGNLKSPELRRLASLLGGMQFTDPMAIAMQETIVQVVDGGSTGLSFARGEFRRHPEDHARAWRYSAATRNAGLAERLNGELGEVVHQHPESIDAVHAFARNEPPARAIPLLETIVAKDAARTELAGSLAVARYRAGDAAGAVRDFSHAWTTKPDMSAVSWYVRALLSTGQPELAATLMESEPADQLNSADVMEYATIIQHFHLTGRTPAADLAKKLEDKYDGLGSWVDSLVPGAGWKDESDDPLHLSTNEIQNAARRSPADAWAACRRNEKALMLIYDPVQLLLALEFDRIGDVALAQKLEHAFLAGGIPFLRAHEFIRTGRPFDEMAFLEPELQAALHYVRARALEAAGQAEAAAPEYAQATQHDVFQGPVTEIMKSWPHPTPLH